MLLPTPQRMWRFVCSFIPWQHLSPCFQSQIHSSRWRRQKSNRCMVFARLPFISPSLAKQAGACPRATPRQLIVIGKPYRISSAFWHLLISGSLAFMTLPYKSILGHTPLFPLSDVLFLHLSSADSLLRHVPLLSSSGPCKIMHSESG